jgi:hypothetical protein
VIEKQPDDVQAADGGGIRQRRPRAEIVALMLSNPVRARWILPEQLADALDVAEVACGRQIDERAARFEVSHDLRGRHRPVAGHIPPTAIKVVTVRDVNGPGAIHSFGVDVRAAAQQLVDRVELPGHRRPVDWLAGSLVALPDELRLRVQQLAHPLQVVIPQRLRNRVALRRGVESGFERVRQQRFHRRVAAIAGNLERIVVHPEIERVVIVLEQESHDFHAVLPHGEVERLAVVVMRARERRISCDQRSHGFEITGDTGLDERPHIGAAARRPQEFLIRFQRGGLAHAVRRLQRFDVVD